MEKKIQIKYLQEHEIQTQIIKYLKAKGYFFWRNNVGKKKNMHFGLKGSADLEGVTPNGIFFAIEVKDHRGLLSVEQLMFSQKVENNNAIYILARCLEHVSMIL